MHYGSYLFGLQASFLMILLFFCYTYIKHSPFLLLSHSLPGVSALHNVARIGLFLKVIVSQIKENSGERNSHVGTKHT